MRLLFMLILMLGACVQLSHQTPTPAPGNDNNWEVLAAGLEQDLIRQESVFFQALRIDPNQYTFRVHYRPNAPLTIQEWQAELPDALVIINANFFTPENTVLGLLISDRLIYGIPYTDRGGMFYVAGNGVGIRNTRTDPYQGENFSQAIQAFPMLVSDGQAAYSNASDTAISRRTLIAQDAQGRIILMVTSGFGMSLYNLSQYLPTTDLEIVTALNLDGGGSTMMYIAPSDTTVLSFDPVPAVLAVYLP